MVSTETLKSYLTWKLPFTVHTDVSDKQLGSFISYNNKPIDFFSRRLIKPQHKYTMTKKELLAIVECLNQFRGILFGYEINVFSNHKNMVYVATLSESQRVMGWRIILKDCGPTIQHIAGVENVVAYMLSRFLPKPSNKYDTCTSKSQCCANDVFTIGRVENNKDCFPLNLLTVQI